MSRFNVVLLGSKPALKNEVPAIVRKVFSSCLVMTAHTADEATLFLEALHIDLLLVDLDEQKFDIAALNHRFPDLQVYAVSKNPQSSDFPAINPQNRLIPLQTLTESLKTELKALKKAGELPLATSRMKKSEAAALPAEFNDYASLMHSS